MHGANFAFNHVSSPQGVTAYGALGAGAPPGAAAARNDSGADAAGAYQGGGLKRAATAAYAASPPKPPATKSRSHAAPVTIITRKDQYRAFPYVPEGTRVKFLRGRECVEGLLFASFDVAVTARAVSDPDLHELGGGGPVCVYKGVPYHVQPGRDLKAIIVVGAAAAAGQALMEAGPRWTMEYIKKGYVVFSPLTVDHPFEHLAGGRTVRPRRSPSQGRHCTPSAVAMPISVRAGWSVDRVK